MAAKINQKKRDIPSGVDAVTSGPSFIRLTKPSSPRRGSTPHAMKHSPCMYVFHLHFVPRLRWGNQAE